MRVGKWGIFGQVWARFDPLSPSKSPTLALLGSPWGMVGRVENKKRPY